MEVKLRIRHRKGRVVGSSGQMGPWDLRDRWEKAKGSLNKLNNLTPQRRWEVHEGSFQKNPHSRARFKEGVL